MATKLWAIGLTLVFTLFASLAQLFYKLGMNNFSLFTLLTNYNLFLGIFLYFAGSIVLIFALKGGELSVLYPFIGTSYIWVSLLAMFFLFEQINPLRWTGIVIIILGISFMGFGTKK